MSKRIGSPIAVTLLLIFTYTFGEASAGSDVSPDNPAHLLSGYFACPSLQAENLPSIASKFPCFSISAVSIHRLLDYNLYLPFLHIMGFGFLLLQRPYYLLFDLYHAAQIPWSFFPWQLTALDRVHIPWARPQPSATSVLGTGSVHSLKQPKIQSLLQVKVSEVRETAAADHALWYISTITFPYHSELIFCAPLPPLVLIAMTTTSLFQLLLFPGLWELCSCLVILQLLLKH